ncbi:MAG: hypothetical protein U0P81_11650 [Holophagaceae bacterium]
MDYYVRIYADRIVARNVDTGESAEVRPSEPYVHPRCLVGNLSSAERTFVEAFGRVKSANVFRRVRLLVHPCFDVPGGLCEAEERMFRQIAYDASGVAIHLWVGAELGDDQVRERLRAR